ncbi:Glucan endo-1,3-alpha-glucosidase agn1 [Leucoagaricus sp. SymC.cos]|nr:Glucan endo-1,3-alpha-glucosidase agn1 [Leucoagaricus sp. SymC.cos]
MASTLVLRPFEPSSPSPKPKTEPKNKHPPKLRPPPPTQLPSLPPQPQPPQPPLPSPPPPPKPTPTEEPRLVSAHFIVGNTYTYTVDDWSKDMTLAASKGIDAFALNIGHEAWQFRRVDDAYTAAQALTVRGINFKLFPSFDMSTLPCAIPSQGTALKDFVEQHYNHPNQFKYQGKMFVTTFGGSHCLYGERKMDDGWRKILKNSSIPVFLVTAFFEDPALYGGYKTPDGALAWNSAWPMGNYPINSDYDEKYFECLGNRTYMAAVSPWMFTHYGPSSFHKNFIYRGDDWLFAARWELLIQQRKKIHFVQVISWNDYGESHYIGPIAGVQPASQQWTDGFDHQGWLDLMQYYIIAFKTGEYPEITKDRAFLWGRLYPKDVYLPSDPVGKPRNWEFTQDMVWAVVLLKAESQVTFSCGVSRRYVRLPAGASKINLNVLQECAVTIVVARMGAVVLDFAPPGFIFRRDPKLYNFNAFVAASPP